MKTWKLVSGILSIVLSGFVFFQSGIVGLGNALTDNGETSGMAGFVVGSMLLSGGILSIVSRKGIEKGGHIALSILYGIGALVGLNLAGNYSDLDIWGKWCLVCAVLAIVSLKKGKKVEK
ncbi:hypothetical protein AXF21_05870 [Eubacterium minutum ATCC 700079]|nr:hypothetical protein AXF21_05870 [Eubacterium minutum ATCC 700079]